MWEAAGAICAILMAIAGVAGTWIKREMESEARAREASASVIIKNQDDLKLDLKTVSDAFERRVDRLEQQSRDFRPGAQIDAAINHSKTNLQQMIEGVRLNGERTALSLDALRDRVTVVETKHESTAKAVNELKAELKETRHEINERLDQMTDMQRDQFNQICNSIREVSERKPKA